MLEVKAKGWAKAVGVSNFGLAQLEGLKSVCEVEGLDMPEVNQVELHCWHQQPKLRAFHEANGIVTMGYCPLARMQKMGDPVLTPIAERIGKTEPQVALRWSLQAGIITIPKSISPSRVAQNGDAADKFELSEADMEAIASVDCQHKASGSVLCQDLPWDDVK